MVCAKRGLQLTIKQQSKIFYTFDTYFRKKVTYFLLALASEKETFKMQKRTLLRITNSFQINRNLDNFLPLTYSEVITET